MPIIGAADIRSTLQQYVQQHPELKTQASIPATALGDATKFVNDKLGGQGTITADVVRGQLVEIAAAQAARGTAGVAAMGGPVNGTVAGASAGAPRASGSLPFHPGMFGTVEAGAGNLAAAQAAKDKGVVEVFTQPARRTSTTVGFDIGGPGGRELKPGEKLLFQMPPELRGAAIRTVVLVHRKDDKYKASVDASGRDQQGAYDLVTARKSGQDSWVTWRDQFGDKKFAEPRPANDPENEILHDWLKSVGQQAVDLVQVANVGVGQNAVSNVHRIEIEFFPPGKVLGQQEEIFTPGTQFADPSKGRLEPSYGGGQGSHLSADDLKTKGLYPNAVALGGYGGGEKKLSENAFQDSSGRLHIKLPPGQTLGGLELAAGDTDFDRNRPAEQQRNKDGHYGQLGWAKMFASIVNTQSGGGTGQPFISNANVPPSGIISGGPVESGYVTKPGDEIVVEARGHAAWIMGYRLQFTDFKPPQG